jgi:chaperonin GroEL
MFEREKLQERLGKLSGGVAIINIGAPTEVEMREKKDRVDDALHATKAALQEGILPGGGVALVHAREVLAKEKYANVDLDLGRQIVYNACVAPFNKILSNAGYEALETYGLVTRINQVSSDQGYNLKSKCITNLVEDGIIDPTKVTRLALENAVSVAGTVLITESIVYNKPEDKKSDQPVDMGMYE